MISIMDYLYLLVPVDDDVPPQLGAESSMSVCNDVAESRPFVSCNCLIVIVIISYRVGRPLLSWSKLFISQNSNLFGG